MMKTEARFDGPGLYEISGSIGLETLWLADLPLENPMHGKFLQTHRNPEHFPNATEAECWARRDRIEPIIVRKLTDWPT